MTFAALGASPASRFRGCLRRAALAAALAACGAPHAASDADAAAALRASHESLRAELDASPFKRPLHLTSAEASGRLRGDVDAVLEQPFARVAQALAAAEQWCEVLVLQPNVKQCRAEGPAASRQLSVHIARRFDQPIEDTHAVRFDYRVVAATPEHLHVTLAADEGPLGTRDYRIALQAAPLDGGRTLMHFSYSYAYGALARIAMKAYLSTSGSDKVGFSIVGRGADGEPKYIDGVRGAVERNTMRYQLAIEAYLASLAAPPAEQGEARLKQWMAAIARYPRQLQEADPAAFTVAKRRDIQRQKESQAKS